MSVEALVQGSTDYNGEASQQQSLIALKQMELSSLSCFNTKGGRDILSRRWKNGNGF